ncbi:pyridoxal phosphate-dependent aminotransferase [soil metagenome]
MEIETRFPEIGTSIFTVMSELARSTGAVNLGQGFPDFAPPAPLVEGVTRAMARGYNQYAPTNGIQALREAIAEKTEACHGVRVCPDTEVTVTSGASEGILNAVLGVVRPGDEVILLDPAYDAYGPAVLLAGGTAVHVPLDPRHFRVDWERLEAALSPRTRLLILNTPHNPSGAVWEAGDMARLDALLGDTEILVLSDEVYEHMVFGGASHESVLRTPGLARRSFVLSSFGKTYHCTGWKVGYCVAPAALTREFRKIHQCNTYSTFTPAQWALAEMIRERPEHHEELGSFLETRRDRFAAGLASTRFRPLPVGGGYFQLVDYSAVSDLPDLEFARWLCTERGVASIPLSPFYAEPPDGQRLVRLCFAKDDETLAAGLARLSET